MAIYDHKYGDLPYFRVFRAWGGKEYQEYVRIKRNRDAAYKKALEIDEKLAQRQRAYFTRQAYTPEYHLRKDGRIRGLRRVTVVRAGRAPTDVLELRINIPWEDKIHRTTLSIDIHGLEKCFIMAVDKICEWYGLDKSSDLRKAMMGAMKLYAQPCPPASRTDADSSAKTTSTKTSSTKTTSAKTPKAKSAASARTAPAQSASTQTVSAQTNAEPDEALPETAPPADEKREGGALKRAQDELSQFTEGLFRAIKKFRDS